MLLRITTLLALHASFSHAQSSPGDVVAAYRRARTATMQERATSADVEALGRLLTDSIVYEHAQARARIVGREAVTSAIQSFLGATRAARVQVIREMTTGNTVASEEWVTFEMRRDTAWVPMRRAQLSVYRVEGERIAAESQSWGELPPAQDVIRKPFPADANYFDFWEGTWYRVVNGRPDTSSTRFIVQRGVHPSSWEEEWRMRLDSVTVINARGIRSWDATRGRWGYLWVSSDGHFQEWECRKVGDEWYIYRGFAFPNDRYLSRQAWLPIGPGRVRRISQKSYDNGGTWELRFEEEYVRAPN